MSEEERVDEILAILQERTTEERVRHWISGIALIGLQIEQALKALLDLVSDLEMRIKRLEARE